MKNRIKILHLIITIFIAIPLISSVESRNMFNQGLEAFKAGNFASAELLFRKTEEFNDDYRDRAWFYLARTIFQQGKYKSAIFEFNAFLTKCRTENLRIESRFWIAESYFNLNEMLKAIEEYNRFLEKSDDLRLVLTSHDRIATIYSSQNRYEESIMEWEKAIKKSSDRELNAQYVLKIGTALFKNGDFKNALERLNPLLSSRIDSKKKGEIRLIIGRIYQLQNDHKKALITFNAIPTDLAELYPYYNMYYFRALSYIETDRDTYAKTDLELFSILGKKSEFYTDGLYEYGRIMLKSNKPESGIEVLEKVWESQEKIDLSIKSALLMADFYIEKDPLKSIHYLEKFANYDDEELKKKIIIIISKAYIKNENYDSAETKLNYYLEHYPYDENIDEVKFLQARILLEKDDPDKAKLIFDDLKKNNPFSKFLNDSDYYLALVNYKKGRFTEAVSYLKRYISLKDINYSFEAHRLLTELYIESEDYKNAEKEINFLLGRFPKYSGVDRLVFKFALLLDEKTNNRSSKYFNILQRRYPDSNYSVMINLISGNRLFESRNYSKAIQFYEKFLNSNIEDNRGTAYYNLLVSYYNVKDYSKVIDIIKNIKIPPLNEEQWREIPLIHARSQYMLSKYDEVYNILRWEDIKRFNDKDASMLVASTLKAGDVKAAEIFIENLKGRPEIYFEQLFVIADHYKSADKPIRAEEIYNQIVQSSSSEKTKETAMIELALIKLNQEDYNLSLNYLNRVELEENVPERDSLIIINHFKMGLEEQAASITESRIKFILKNRFSENVLKLNLEYFYKMKNSSGFNIYASYLKPFKDSTDYVNYYSGKLYFETGDYRRSYNYFYKLSLGKNDFMNETFFHLGKLSLLYFKNRNSALKYFQKVIELKSNNDLVLKSKIEIAIIYHEMKKNQFTFDLLNEVITDNTNSKYRTDAENLLEYYGLRNGPDGGNNL